MPTVLNSTPGQELRSFPVLDHLQHRWGWFVALGLLSALLGLTALVLVVSATIASVFMIAIFMIIAGGTEIATGLASKTWSRFFLWVVAGLFYVAGGAFALAQPLLAAAVFTFMLGAALVATGIMRIVIGSHMGQGARGPMIGAGAITALIGVLILLGWPANSFVLLGALLGFDLLFSGVGWILFGLRLRRHT